MAKHKYGLLLSQLLDCVSKPLEEEQVWALCFEIFQSLLNYLTKAVNPSDEMVLNSGEVTLAVETIYLRRDGRITFVPNSNLRNEILDERRESLMINQMKDLSKVLSTCLENSGPNEFLKRQVGSDLESLMRIMSFGEYTQGAGGPQWISDCCLRHAYSQTDVPPSEYYCEICELLVKEAMEMNNFLTVVTSEITQCECKHDAFSTFQLSQARPVISNWLQCMSEIRESATHNIESLRSPISIQHVTLSSCYNLKNPLQSPDVYDCPPRSKIFLPTIEEQVRSPEGDIQLPKPTYHSTPTVVCKKTRKVLRPPQRLVNQVTTWILEGEPKADSSCSYDVSWLPGQQLSHVSSSLGWFHEAKRIRRVLTELQVDTAMDHEALYKALRGGEICFCCRVTKFTLFHRPHINCEVCERKICHMCITRVTSRDLGVSSRDSSFGSRDLGMSSRDSGMSSRDFESGSCDDIDTDNGSIFGQIRKVFKPKTGGSGEKYCNLCKDCRDFIQRYF